MGHAAVALSLAIAWVPPLAAETRALALSEPGGAQQATAVRGDATLPEARAPDGYRGLGRGLSEVVLAQVFRAPAPEDARFLHDLWELARDVEVLTAVAAARYEALGYFALVDRASDRLELDIIALHRGFRTYERRALLIPLGERRALALARALSDPYFRARMQILEDVDYDLQQLRGGLNLLLAHAFGRAQYYRGSELDAVTWRIDLAASRLRAAREDLEALYQPVFPGSGFSGSGFSGSGEGDWMANEEDIPRLARALSKGTGSAGRVLLNEVRRRTRTQASKLPGGSLASFNAEFKELLQKRRLRSRKAIEGYSRMLSLLPFNALGVLPSGLEGQRIDRCREAANTGLEAVELDPLLPDLQYMLGLSFDFYAGRSLSIPRYSRYLALRGIRDWDQSSFRYRELTAAELQALYVVSDWKPIPEKH